MYRELTNVFIDAKSIAILGDIGAGKTSCAFKILELCKDDRDVFFYNHPNVDLLSELSYQNITLNDIANKENSIIVLDEIQLSSNLRKRDKILSKMLSLSRQKNNMLILITSDSRTLSPSVEGYIDFWIIKDYEYSMTKQRSKVRNIITEHCDIDPDSFSLSVNEMVIYCRRLRNKISVKDIYFCDLPTCWSDKLSKSYSKSINYNDDKTKTHDKLMTNSCKTPKTHETVLPTQLNNSLNLFHENSATLQELQESLNSPPTYIQKINETNET